VQSEYKKRKKYEYCGKKNLPHQQVGKLIVATRDAELPILEELYEQAMANGVLELSSYHQRGYKSWSPMCRHCKLCILHTLASQIMPLWVSPLLKISFLQAVVKSTQGQLPSPFSWLIDSPEEFICSSFHNLCNLHVRCDLLRNVGN